MYYIQSSRILPQRIVLPCPSKPAVWGRPLTAPPQPGRRPCRSRSPAARAETGSHRRRRGTHSCPSSAVPSERDRGTERSTDGDLIDRKFRYRASMFTPCGKQDGLYFKCRSETLFVIIVMFTFICLLTLVQNSIRRKSL